MLRPASQRVVAFFLLIAVFASSCSTSSPSNAYPTYDPFAPVGGGNSQVAPVQVGEFVRATQMAGSTPTRASLTVNVVPQNRNSTPTPDIPHALPTQRDV